MMSMDTSNNNNGNKMDLSNKEQWKKAFKSATLSQEHEKIVELIEQFPDLQIENAETKYEILSYLKQAKEVLLRRNKTLSHELKTNRQKFHFNQMQKTNKPHFYQKYI